MKKITLITAAIFAYCILHTAYCFSQGTAINNNGAAADNSALLDLSSTEKGFVLPRMTTDQRNAIVSPANGLMIFNNDCGNINYYFGGSWYPLNNGVANIPGWAGTITGSSLVCPGQNGVSYSASAANATSYTWTYSGTGFTVATGNGSGNITVNFSPSATSGTLTVFGTNACGNGTVSDNFPVIINSNPAVPTANPASDISCTEFTANWSVVSGATGYYLDVSADAGFGSFLAGYNNFDAGNVYSKNITGLTGNKNYYYRVRAYNSCGTSGSSGATTVLTHVPYVEITLTNNESFTTVQNFIQMITVNSSAFTSYESSGLENVEFSTGPSASGNILQAWIESGASNLSTGTVYWVNMGTSTIPANGSLTIYMNFMPANVMSAAGPTGKAPQLSGTYGQDDNGALVFPFYENYAGSSLSGKWTSGVSNGTVTVNNGLTITVPWNAPGGSYAYVSTASYQINSAMVIESCANTNSFYISNFRIIPVSITQYNNTAWHADNVPNENGAGWVGDALATTTISAVTATSSASNYFETSQITSNSNYNVFSVFYPNNGNVSVKYNYTSWGSTGTYVPSTPLYVSISNFVTPAQSYNNVTYNLDLHWTRTRTYPPNGVMPTATPAGSAGCL